jgi:hypothetical protein
MVDRHHVPLEAMAVVVTVLNRLLKADDQTTIRQIIGGRCQLVDLYRLWSVWHIRPMKTAMPANPYQNHRFPAEIISHAVWLSFRFCLSSRAVEERLLARGVIVTDEAIRKWGRKCGQSYAHQLRRRRPQPGEEWPRDEVFLTRHGERHSLWRGWIRTVTSWISWCNAGATSTRPRRFAASS